MVACKKIGRANTYVRLLFLLFIGFPALVGGCAHLPFCGQLNPGIHANHQSNRNAWLSKVEIIDQSMADGPLNSNTKSELEESLSLNLLDYLNQAHGFSEVKLLPGKLEKTDVVLRFQFDRYQEKVFLLFPLPVLVDSSNLSANLIVEDSRGSVITEVRSQTQEKHFIIVYGHFRDIQTRSNLIKDLIDKAMDNLQEQES
jgi:hypothetical protein